MGEPIEAIALVALAVIALLGSGWHLRRRRKRPAESEGGNG